MMLRRLLLLIIVVLIIWSTLLEHSAQRRLEQLQQRLGPGRGRVPRAAQRRIQPIDVYANFAQQGDVAFRAVTRFTQAQFDSIVREMRPLITANRNVRPNVADPGGRLHSSKMTVSNRVLLLLKFLVCGGSCGDLASQFGV